MQKKNIEIKLDNQTNPWKWVALILFGILIVDLSCAIGTITGGLIGYSLGRKVMHAGEIIGEELYAYPYLPDVPGYPGLPYEPLPEPRLDLPFVPHLSNRPRLGVTFITTDAGAEIVGIIPGSPAEKVGLLIGDVITRVNGQNVTQDMPLNELIMRYQPGDTVTLTVSRGGQTRKIDVKLAAEPQG